MLTPSAASSPPSSATEGDLAVYVHWPFCLSKCPYCDFNSHVAAGIDPDRWRRALCAEIDHAAAGLAGRRVTSVFFGGGTPSLMAPTTTAAVLDRIAAHWSVAVDAEVTLEANPTSVEAERFRDFRAAGVNRVSIGVQALDDRALAFLGRGHDRSQALAAVALARRVFPRFSFDLIYARPGQEAGAWRRELEEAVALAGDHLSAYQLTIERGTPFFAAHRDRRFVLPDEDGAAALWETTQAVTEAAGLPAYEVSNHAAPGAESRHNLAYWRHRDYLGIGPGAHGRLREGDATVATERIRNPDRWLDAVESEGHALCAATPVAPAELAEEMLMMGLRIAEGIELDAVRRRTGRALDHWVAPARLAACRDVGYVEVAGGRLRLTRRGRPLLDAVLARLLA